MKPSTIAEKYGEITYSQFNCLSCRTAMYICSIALCKKMGIKIIAEGARKDQGFVIELDNMIGHYEEILKRYNIQLLVPVHNLNNNWELKCELIDSHFVPKTFEPQCIIGFPLDKPQLDDDVINGTVNFFTTSMINMIDDLVNYMEKNIFDDNGEI